MTIGGWTYVAWACQAKGEWIKLTKPQRRALLTRTATHPSTIRALTEKGLWKDGEPTLWGEFVTDCRDLTKGPDWKTWGIGPDGSLGKYREVEACAADSTNSSPATPSHSYPAGRTHAEPPSNTNSPPASA